MSFSTTSITVIMLESTFAIRMARFTTTRACTTLPTAAGATGTAARAACARAQLMQADAGRRRGVARHRRAGRSTRRSHVPLRRLQGQRQFYSALVVNTSFCENPRPISRGHTSKQAPKLQVFAKCLRACIREYFYLVVVLFGKKRSFGYFGPV